MKCFFNNSTKEFIDKKVASKPEWHQYNNFFKSLTSFKEYLRTFVPVLSSSISFSKLC